eukprot:5729520-Amphidinium_carterae.2
MLDAPTLMRLPKEDSHALSPALYRRNAEELHQNHTGAPSAYLPKRNRDSLARWHSKIRNPVPRSLGNSR